MYKVAQLVPRTLYILQNKKRPVPKWPHLIPCLSTLLPVSVDLAISRYSEQRNHIVPVLLAQLISPGIMSSRLAEAFIRIRFILTVNSIPL